MDPPQRPSSASNAPRTQEEPQRRPSSAMAAPSLTFSKTPLNVNESGLTRPPVAPLQVGASRTTEDIFSSGGSPQQFSSSASHSSTAGANLAFFSMPELPSMMQFQNQPQTMRLNNNNNNKNQVAVLL